VNVVLPSVTPLPKAIVKRPVSITVICVVLTAAILLNVATFSLSSIALVGAWFLPYLVLTIILQMVSVAGLWMMKKWGAYTYIGIVTLNQLVLIAAGQWNALNLLVPIIVIFFVVRNISKMT
jgi:hypothetical protein